jgi:selenocysteine lyase/cysteine desulfurase
MCTKRHPVEKLCAGGYRLSNGGFGCVSDTASYLLRNERGSTQLSFGRFTMSRRVFLARLAALSSMAHGVPSVSSRSSDTLQSAALGLATADDFAFAPGLVYLQTGSLGPTPRPIRQRTLDACTQLELNPTLYGYGALETAMDEVRARAAAFLGCAKDELVLTSSTTDGMNWVAQGLGLGAGDRVLTTDQEHPGGRRCWDHVARRHGVAIDVVAIPPDEHDAASIVRRFEAAIAPRTRVVSFAHLLSSTGLRMPVAELCGLARSRGCLAVVDGAQAAGGVQVDVKTLGCHVYATSGHKWLLGPKGTGLLYLGAEIGRTVDPIALEAGRAAYSDSSGFRNLPGVLGLGAAVEYVSGLGLARIEAHNLALRNRLYQELQGVPKLRVVSAPPGPLASPLLTYALPDDVESAAFQQRMLERHQVMLKVVPKQWLNGNRVSCHLFNTDRDIDRLVEALRRELA